MRKHQYTMTRAGIDLNGYFEKRNKPLVSFYHHIPLRLLLKNIETHILIHCFEYVPLEITKNAAEFSMMCSEHVALWWFFKLSRGPRRLQCVLQNKHSICLCCATLCFGWVMWLINALISGRYGFDFESEISKHMWRIKFMSTSTFVLRWMRQNTFGDMSTLFQVMAWCR